MREEVLNKVCEAMDILDVAIDKCDENDSQILEGIQIAYTYLQDVINDSADEEYEEEEEYDE